MFFNVSRENMGRPGYGANKSPNLKSAILFHILLYYVEVLASAKKLLMHPDDWFTNLMLIKDSHYTVLQLMSMAFNDLSNSAIIL